MIVNDTLLVKTVKDITMIIIIVSIRTIVSHLFLEVVSICRLAYSYSMYVHVLFSSCPTSYSQAVVWDQPFVNALCVCIRAMDPIG